MRKILVIEVAGLGDLVHSLPALWALREGHPDAQLHCVVQERYASLLSLTPWIDRVIPFRRRARIGDWGQHLRQLLDLRTQRYDLAVDLMGADISSSLAGLSGARRRWIRKPGLKKWRWGWRLFATDLLEVPFGRETMYRQRLRCVQQAGIPVVDPEFRLLDLPPRDPRACAGVRPYIHLSPYTKVSRKELPPEQLAAIVAGLMERFHDHDFAISCSSNVREREALEQLLGRLPQRPQRIYAGTLDIPGLMQLIAGAVLHLGGDTGTIHLAWLLGTRSVSWFRWSEGARQWAPQGDRHCVIKSYSGKADHLKGIDTGAVLAAAGQALRPAG